MEEDPAPKGDQRSASRYSAYSYGLSSVGSWPCSRRGNDSAPYVAAYEMNAPKFCAA